MPYGSGSLLYDPNSSLDFGYMLVGGGQVDSWTPRHRLYCCLEWGKLVVHIQHLDMKSPLEIELMYQFILSEDRLCFTIGEVTHCGERNSSAQIEEEWYLVNKKNVRSHCHVSVEFEKVTRDLNKVRGHMSWLRPRGLSF